MFTFDVNFGKSAWAIGRDAPSPKSSAVSRKSTRARGEDLERWKPPGGESFGDCRDRVLPALHEVMAASEGDVLLVGHAGVNRVILCDVFGMPVGNLFRIGQEYGCFNMIAYRKGERFVRLFNFAPWGLPAEMRRERVELELVATP